jgi:hypothetical protein
MAYIRSGESVPHLCNEHQQVQPRCDCGTPNPNSHYAKCATVATPQREPTLDEVRGLGPELLDFEFAQPEIRPQNWTPNSKTEEDRTIEALREALTYFFVTDNLKHARQIARNRIGEPDFPSGAASGS